MMGYPDFRKDVAIRVSKLDPSATIRAFRDPVFGPRYVVEAGDPRKPYEGCSPQSAWARALRDLIEAKKWRRAAAAIEEHST